MNEPEMLEDITRAMATTAQSVGRLESLLEEISRIGSHIEGVADQVNCMAMNVALEALKSEKTGATLANVAVEAARLEDHALTILVEVSQRVEGLIQALESPMGLCKRNGLGTV